MNDGKNACINPKYYDYLLRRSPSFDELMDEILEKRQLGQYNWKRMIPQGRHAIWEQEHLNELQANNTSPAPELLLDNLEQYTQFLQDQLMLDEHEQSLQINDI